jgi:hypothetical protein
MLAYELLTGDEFWVFAGELLFVPTKLFYYFLITLSKWLLKLNLILGFTDFYISYFLSYWIYYCNWSINSISLIFSINF